VIFYFQISGSHRLSITDLTVTNRLKKYSDVEKGNPWFLHK